MSRVTAAQILAEAAGLRRPLVRPKQAIHDTAELALLQQAQRTEYEQQLNKNRLNYGQWLRYARWEAEHNHDFVRARSVHERALAVDPQHVPFWTRYVKLELQHKNVNHALNILDRAVAVLPRVDKLWFMYAQTEEAVGRVAGARLVFERWLSWRPGAAAWRAYTALELRYGEYDRARELWRRFLAASDPTTAETAVVWRTWLEFEAHEAPRELGQVERTRGTFEAAADALLGTVAGALPDSAAVFALWALWEAAQGEFERASAIYERLFRLDLPAKLRARLHEHYTTFSKGSGARGSVESAVEAKRAAHYRQQVFEDPSNLDAWWALLRLVEQTGTAEEMRSTFGQAVKAPVAGEFARKRHAMLWRWYALWEEFRGDRKRARDVWNRAVEVNSGHLWVGCAEFELRLLNDDASSSNPELGSSALPDALARCRKVLGRALGTAKKRTVPTTVLRFYVALERRLGERSRVRKVYEKWLEMAVSKDPAAAAPVFAEYAAFEHEVGEQDRGYAICEAAISLGIRAVIPAYIEQCKEAFDYERARTVYRRQTTADPQLVDHWIALALFESAILTDVQLQELELSSEGNLEFSVGDAHRAQTRAVFREALAKFPPARAAQRAALLVAWREYELANGTEADVKAVEARQPRAVRRRIVENGVECETVELVFPAALDAFLASAQKWAQKSKDT